MTQIDPYDTAAFEQFCFDLVVAGFNPKPGNPNRWVGPIRPCLEPFADAKYMEVQFRDGWPLRYSYVVVDGLRARHAGNGVVCLWAEDDPAQVAGSTLDGLWCRIDEWAAAAADGFDVADQALDSFMFYDKQNRMVFELPLADLADKSNGFIAHLTGQARGRALQIGVDRGSPELHGAFYLRRDIGMPPANYDGFYALLTKRQREDLSRGLARRAPAELNEPSGGYDFVVLAWPRFDQHDVLALGFAGSSDTLQATAYIPAPSDMLSRRRRAGPDASALSSKRVLVAGLGSIGGGAALALAQSGVGKIRGFDDDVMKTGNLVRHVLDEYSVGFPKVDSLALEIKGRAPWCAFDPQDDDLSLDRTRLADQVAGFDLVIDSTGLFSLTAALSEVCHRSQIPLMTVALFHQGSLMRIQRQADGDTPIASRNGSRSHVQLPPETAAPAQAGFLEVGCTAYVSNAPPWASHRAAADTAATAVDFLSGRRDMDEDQVMVLRPLPAAPFDRVGPVRVAAP